jgi:hypothetical protein
MSKVEEIIDDLGLFCVEVERNVLDRCMHITGGSRKLKNCKIAFSQINTILDALPDWDLYYFYIDESNLWSAQLRLDIKLCTTNS